MRIKNHSYKYKTYFIFYSPGQKNMGTGLLN